MDKPFNKVSQIESDEKANPMSDFAEDIEPICVCIQMKPVKKF